LWGKGEKHVWEARVVESAGSARSKEERKERRAVVTEGD
jgi:hypothetical protein